MAVLNRRRAMRDDARFQQICSDPAPLELSERLFGKIPGTRAFVAQQRKRAP